MCDTYVYIFIFILSDCRSTPLMMFSVHKWYDFTTTIPFINFIRMCLNDLPSNLQVSVLPLNGLGTQLDADFPGRKISDSNSKEQIVWL